MAAAASREPRHPDRRSIGCGRRRRRRAQGRRVRRVRTRGTLWAAAGAVGSRGHADRRQAPVLPGRRQARAAVVAGASGGHRLPGRWRLHHRASVAAHDRRSPDGVSSREHGGAPCRTAGRAAVARLPRPASKYVPAPEPPGGWPLDVTRLASQVARRPEGERNLGLFKAACRMAEHGHSPREALDALGPAADQSGLGEREITRTVGSAYRHVSTYGPRRRAPVRQTGSGFAHTESPVSVSGRGL